jgi:hypothetical protein
MFGSTTRVAACVAAALWLGGAAPMGADSRDGSEIVALEAADQGRGPAVQPTAQAGKPSPGTSGRSGQRPGSSGSPLMSDDRPWLGWWNDPDVRRELGLTDETVRQIGAIVQERFQTSRGKFDEFMRERTKLNRMLSDPATTENSFELQVIKVEKLGSELEIGRTMMLFRILRHLSPDQVRKLEDIARRRNDRDRQSSGGRQGPR